MEEVIEKKETFEKKNLCSLKVEREMEGLKITVKSPLFEEYFLKNSGGLIKTNANSRWGMGQKYYHCDRVSIPRGDYEKSLRVQNYCEYGILDTSSGVYDLSFIRSVGIKDGIVFSCKGMYLQEDIEMFTKDFTKFTKSFFTQYVKKVSIEVNIVSIV